jgi:hypothetical protein
MKRFGAEQRWSGDPNRAAVFVAAQVIRIEIAVRRERLMSEWTDRIGTHVVWQQMLVLGPAIDRALAREGIEPSIIEGIERVRTILTFAGKRLGGADPELISANSLDLIAGGLQQTTSEIEAYVADGDGTHIVNANSHAETILAGLPAINYPFVADDWIALSEAGRSYRSTLEQSLHQVHAALSSIRSDSDGLQQRLLQLGTDLETERTKLATVTTEFQSQFSAGQDTRNEEFTEHVQTALGQIQTDAASLQQRLTELGTEIGTERGRLTTVASEFQSQFSAAQESRSREFAEAQANRQEKFGNIVADYSQRLTEQNAAFTKQRDEAFQSYEANVAELKTKYGDSAKNILDQIESEKKDVEKLVGVIGNLGVTSGYLNTANHARRSMWFWQSITVFALIVLSVLAYKTLKLLEDSSGHFLWGAFAARVLLLGSLGVIAAYAGNQADKHFDIEKRNRKLALELEAIGPYLAPLSQEEQDKFRVQIGERSFGRDDDSSVRTHRKSPATLIDLVKSKEAKDVIDWILEVVRKNKVG